MIDLQAVRDAFSEIEQLQPLSSGGQKQVLKGQRNNDAIVLKLITPGQDPERLRREIKAVEALNCHYVPEVLEVAERRIGSENFVFIVERFVGGQTLTRIIHES